MDEAITGGIWTTNNSGENGNGAKVTFIIPIEL
jgi:hypothetical protein